MGVQRVFLGWSRPALESTVDYLIDRYARGSLWQMDQVLLAVPGGRVGRAIGERLAFEADRRQAIVFPPRIVTVGHLPEELYVARRPFASTLVQQLAWARALRKVSRSCLRAFMAEPPTDPTDPHWMEMGILLWSQHCELAADGLDFRQVAQRGALVSGFRERDGVDGDGDAETASAAVSPRSDDATSDFQTAEGPTGEARRWTALADVQQVYLRLLDGLELWDLQTARLFAVEHHECRSERDLILLGMVDMSRAVRQMLEQVADRVTTLVFASEEEVARFDEFGCLRPEAWVRASIPVSDDQLRLVDGPLGQAQAVVDELAGLEARYAMDDVTIGVPQESLVPWIERECTRVGVPVRYGPGRRVEATGPVRLFRALADFLQSQRFDHLLELLQHPDFRNYLAGNYRRLVDRQSEFPDWEDDWSHLEKYVADHLPVRCTDSWLGTGIDTEGARRMADAIRGLCHRLAGEEQEPAAWVVPLQDWLEEIYGDRLVDDESFSDRQLMGGYQALQSGLDELRQVPPLLSDRVPAWKAILMTVTAMTDRQVPAPPAESAVEMLGWLELPWDPASVLIVTQMNEGTVPTSSNSDLFLPDSLRTGLGLDDNARRYARDAYALHALACSRQVLRLIVARRNAEGYPILPSRLLFAASDEVRAQRCLQFFGESSPSDRGGQHLLELQAVHGDDHTGNPSGKDQVSGLAVPEPDGRLDVNVLTVTDFRIYLECPYRFYLQRVLRLSATEEPHQELDGRAFGNLLHDVLEKFGLSEVRDADDAELISEFFLDELSSRFAFRYGRRPRPSLQIQRQQLQQRLHVFATKQAEWRQLGWQIIQTEVEAQTLETPWQDRHPEMALRGRVDRIDRNELSGQHAILDYKSADKAMPPRKTHHRRTSKGFAALLPEDWVDLQLPLYRHLASRWNITGPIELGYVILPRSLEDVGMKIAGWTEAELAVADSVACGVVAAVRQGIFWPPADAARELNVWDGFDRICQVGVFDRSVAEPCAESRK